MKVVRHGCGVWSEFLIPEKAQSLLSGHGWKATVTLAAAFSYYSNIVFATGNDYMTAELAPSPSQYGDSANPECTRVRFSPQSLCSPLNCRGSRVQTATFFTRLGRPNVTCVIPLPKEVAVLLTDATASFPSDVNAVEIREALRSLILGNCASDWAQACFSYFHANVGVAEENASSERSWAAETPESRFIPAPVLLSAAQDGFNELVPREAESSSDVFKAVCTLLIEQAKVIMIDKSDYIAALHRLVKEDLAYAVAVKHMTSMLGDEDLDPDAPMLKMMMKHRRAQLATAFPDVSKTRLKSYMYSTFQVALKRLKQNEPLTGIFAPEKLAEMGKTLTDGDLQAIQLPEAIQWRPQRRPDWERVQWERRQKGGR